MAQLSTGQFTKMLKLSHEMSRVVGCGIKPLVHTFVSSARNCGFVVGVLWMQLDVTAPRLNILPTWTHVSWAKSAIWQTNYAIQSWIQDIHVMSSYRQALKHFWVATLLRTTDPNWSPDATNDRQVSSTTSYTCTFHLRWLLLGKFPVPAQFLLVGMPWWWSSQTVSEGDHSLVSGAQYHVFCRTVPFCFTLLFIVLVFSNKTLGTSY